MSIVAWIVVGLVAGWLTGILMGTGGYGVAGDLIVGVLGAMAGGSLASALLGIDLSVLDTAGLAASAAGAIILMALYRAVVVPRQSIL